MNSAHVLMIFPKYCKKSKIQKKWNNFMKMKGQEK